MVTVCVCSSRVFNKIYLSFMAHCDVAAVVMVVGRCYGEREDGLHEIYCSVIGVVEFGVWCLYGTVSPSDIISNS